MTRLCTLPASIQHLLENRCLVKVISGLSNFDQESVALVARSAGIGGADILDVACDPDLVCLAKQESGLPVCVSAVDPKLFSAAVDAGASMIEIGNFDSFYPKGRIFDADEVLDLTSETRKLLPEVPLSVTVPHVLSLDQQAQLAIDLVSAGADIIQTEGGTSAKPFSPGNLGLIEKAAPTLAATYAISQIFQKNDIQVPILSASGLSEVTIPMAIASGASGIGIGSIINKLNNELAMIAAVKSIINSIKLPLAYQARAIALN